VGASLAEEWISHEKQTHLEASYISCSKENGSNFFGGEVLPHAPVSGRRIFLATKFTHTHTHTHTKQFLTA
jgi:hypothetical protein